MLILDRWSWRFWSLTRTNLKRLGVITALKQNQIKFRQQIPAISPFQDSPITPELMKLLQSLRQAPSSSPECILSTQAENCFRCYEALVLHILHGPPRAPSRSLLAQVPDEEHQLLQHLMSSPSSWPKWSMLFKNKAFSNHLSLHLCALKNAYQAMTLKGEFLLKKPFGSPTAEWAQLRL